jgi:hypothetical protein
METQSAMKPIGSNVFVTIPEALQTTIKTKNGVELYIDPSFEPEQWAITTAIVHSVGDRFTHNIKKGDEVMVSYLMVADYYTIDGERIFNRVKRYNNEVVWEAEEFMVLAVKRETEWEGVGKWVILDDIKGEELKSSFLIIPDSVQTKVLKGCGKFISGNLDLPSGTKVYFNEMFRSYYKFPEGIDRMIMDKELIFAYGDE